MSRGPELYKGDDRKLLKSPSPVPDIVTGQPEHGHHGSDSASGRQLQGSPTHHMGSGPALNASSHELESVDLMVPKRPDELKPAFQTYIDFFHNDKHAGYPPKERESRKSGAKKMCMTLLQQYINELKKLPQDNTKVEYALQEAEYDMTELRSTLVPIFNGNDTVLVEKRLAELEKMNSTAKGKKETTDPRNRRTYADIRDRRITSQIKAVKALHNLYAQETPPNDQEIWQARQVYFETREARKTSKKREGSPNIGESAGGHAEKQKYAGPEPDMTVVPEQPDDLKAAHEEFIRIFLRYHGETKLSTWAREQKARARENHIKLQKDYIEQLAAKQTDEALKPEGKRALELALMVANFYIEELQPRHIPVFDGTNDELVKIRIESLDDRKDKNRIRKIERAKKALVALQTLQDKKRDGRDITYSVIADAIENYSNAVRVIEQPGRVTKSKAGSTEKSQE